MIELFGQNIRTNRRQSSKGNQLKWENDGIWYKADYTGYEGLASHGGTLGLIISLWLYCRKTKMNYMDVVDMIAVATPITACFIRLANLMNSEIIGKVTDVPWAFVFEREDMQPRHPAQLYEAIAYFIFFLIYAKYITGFYPLL